MKKLALAFSVLILGLTSCSNDDGSGTNTNSILVAQINETINYNGNTETNTINFTYNGNKLVSESYGNGNINFTYTGELITKIEYFLGTVKLQEELFTYNNSEKLINFQRIEYDNSSGNYGVNVDYIYNSNGTINYTKFSGYLPNLSPSSTGVVNLNSEGLVATINTSTGYTYSFDYDDKNSPFKNIQGFNKLIFYDDEGYQFVRNIISKTELNNGSSSTINYTYSYDANDFPSLSVGNDGFETVTRQYSYNQ